MDNINKKITKITLSTIAVGAIIVPVQSATSHIDLDNPHQTNTASIQTEHHPHPTDIGSWQNHFVDPKSLRAVGNDSGKTEKNDNSDPWKIYNARAA